MTEPTAVWAYAVAEHLSLSRLDGLDGVSGGPVRAVAAAGLTAVAGDVPVSGFGEAALRRNLEDLAWLEVTARAHHRVVEAIAADGPVVPMRLATVYHDDPGLAAALAERGRDLRAALARTRAHTEWGVKAYAARPTEPRDAGQGPERSRGSERRRSSGSGAAYLARRRQELSAHESARRDAAASAELIHRRLSRLADGNRLHPPQSPQLAGARAQMILNAAYLLDDRRSNDFAAVVSDLASRHPAVRLELTGPWPPYSFAGLPEAGPA